MALFWRAGPGLAPELDRTSARTLHRPDVPRPTRPTYWAATRHPFPCLVFLLPLLLAYEGSVLYLGGADHDTLRNGADAWLRGSLFALGLQDLLWAPVFLVFGLIACCLVRRSDQPEDVIGVCTGMTIESVFAAIGLYLASRGLKPAIDRFATLLQVEHVDGVTANLVSYIGAGIYEEVLFRVLLFGGLCWVLRLFQLPGLAVVVLATIAASLAFAAAHHIGPYGETFDRHAFVFRSLAGFYFTILYRLRGFGIAVGAHACYDVFVGVAIGP
jgi:membrane protease YdiL (CAAX protease family)